MNDRRTYLLIGLSVLLHLVVLRLLPPPDFETDQPDEERSLRVSLLDRDRTRRDEGERAPREEDVRTEESAPEEQSPEPKTESEQAPDEGSTASPRKPPEPPRRRDLPEPPDPERSPPSKVTPDRPEPTPSDKSAEPAPREAPEASQRKEPQYDLLAGGPGSGASTEASDWIRRDTQTDPRRPRTALANEDLEKFEVVETFEADHRRGDTVKVEVPDPSNDTRGVVKAPAYTVSRTDPDPSALGDTDDATDDYRQPTLPSGGREILSQPLPTVPGWLEETGEEVRVIVRYDINQDGEVSSVEILTSSGYPDLDGRVVEKTRKWRFESGPRVEHRLAVFRFVLD